MQPTDAPIDGHGLEMLVREHQAAVFRRALSLSGRTSDAWDLLQDTFERAFRGLSRDYPQDKVRGWLLLTLKNLFIDRQRASRRQRLLPLLDDLAAPEPSSERLHWRRVDDEALDHCLGQLDARLREVYLLRVAEGLSLASIGVRLGIPLATAGTRLHRARARLRCLLTSGTELPAAGPPVLAAGVTPNARRPVQAGPAPDLPGLRQRRPSAATVRAIGRHGRGAPPSSRGGRASIPDASIPGFRSNDSVRLEATLPLEGDARGSALWTVDAVGIHPETQR